MGEASSCLFWNGFERLIVSHYFRDPALDKNLSYNKSKKLKEGAQSHATPSPAFLDFNAATMYVQVHCTVWYNA